MQKSRIAKTTLKKIKDLKDSQYLILRLDTMVLALRQLDQQNLLLRESLNRPAYIWTTVDKSAKAIQRK